MVEIEEPPPPYSSTFKSPESQTVAVGFKQKRLQVLLLLRTAFVGTAIGLIIWTGVLLPKMETVNNAAGRLGVFLLVFLYNGCDGLYLFLHRKKEKYRIRHYGERAVCDLMMALLLFAQIGVSLSVYNEYLHNWKGSIKNSEDAEDSYTIVSKVGCGLGVCHVCTAVFLFIYLSKEPTMPDEEALQRRAIKDASRTAYFQKYHAVYPVLCAPICHRSCHEECRIVKHSMCRVDISSDGHTRLETRCIFRG